MDLYNLIISAKLSKGEGGDVSVDPLSVTENGTYTAPSGHAYSPVTVNVPSVTPTGNIDITSTAQTDVSAYATAQVVDADLVAGNIKKDVNILGVTGTYEGGGGGDDDGFRTLVSGGSTSGGTQDIVVPEGVTRVRDRCFQAFYGYINIDLPSTITSIGAYAFHNSTGIKKLTLRAVTPPLLSTNNAQLASIPIYVPSGSVEAYKAASEWSNYASKIQAIPE